MRTRRQTRILEAEERKRNALPLTSLPTELLLMIAAYLDPPTLVSISRTCRHSHKVFLPALPARLIDPRYDNYLRAALHHYITDRHEPALKRLLRPARDRKLKLPDNIGDFTRPGEPSHPVTLAATLTDVAILQRMLNSYCWDWPDAYCPIRIAASTNNVSMLGVLVFNYEARQLRWRSSMAPEWRCFENAVRAAAKYEPRNPDAESALEYFLKQGVTDELREVMLMTAVRFGKLRHVKRLLEDGARPRDHWVPLAAQLGHAEVALELVAAGSPVDAVDDDGRTALGHVAMWTGLGAEYWPAWREGEAEDTEGWKIKEEWKPWLETGEDTRMGLWRVRVEERSWEEGGKWEEKAESWEERGVEALGGLVRKGANVRVAREGLEACERLKRFGSEARQEVLEIFDEIVEELEEDGVVIIR